MVDSNNLPVHDYDVALSFAGENRQYVKEVADILHQLGVRVFYDEYEATDLWGKNLYTHLDDVYRRRSRFCVMFVSEHYKRKVWTNHERESAQARALEEQQEYVLPARFDDTEIPGLRPTVGYMDLRFIEPSQLVEKILGKLGLKSELDDMVAVLKKNLPDDYTITISGTSLCFSSQSERYNACFPVRLMMEMYRADELIRMFLLPGIVPH